VYVTDWPWAFTRWEQWISGISGWRPTESASCHLIISGLWSRVLIFSLIDQNVFNFFIFFEFLFLLANVLINLHLFFVVHFLDSKLNSANFQDVALLNIVLLNTHELRTLSSCLQFWYCCVWGFSQRDTFVRLSPCSPLLNSVSYSSPNRRHLIYEKMSIWSYFIMEGMFLYLPVSLTILRRGLTSFSVPSVPGYTMIGASAS